MSFAGGLVPPAAQGLSRQDERAARPMIFAGFGAAAGPLVDPPGSSVVVAAVAWLQGTLLGSLASIVAVIAIASVGLMMLSGRVNIRYGLTIILGCFILFGASTIAAGIMASLSGADQVARTDAPPAPPPMVAPPPAPPPPANRDPYAGASVPSR
jgi:type IV secretory pathway VirB2 component (pilin)